MGSTRLPGKVLELIGDKVLLEHILGRLGMLRHDTHDVVATSIKPRDDAIADFCRTKGVDCFRGSESDVLARYYECAREHSFDHVVRLTGDNPFTDVEELDRLLDFHLKGNYEYSYSFEDLPIGVGAEIFAMKALERSFRDGHARHHREHVDEYVLENRSLFRMGRLSVPQSKRRPDVRLTVDTLEDLRRARFVAERSSVPWVSTEEAVRLCSLFA
jgi:spore coat polysaccharide biosynthesis protein SpsF